jgi:hypothetical protein
MTPGWLRWIGIALLTPATALAFEIVDTLPFPSRGGFPDAYSRDPIYPTLLWAQAGLMYHSNPFGIPDGANPPAFLGEDQKWDAIARYGVGVIHSQRIIGRQSLRLHARAEYYDYFTFNELDHLGYDVGASWLWEIGNNLSGEIGYERFSGLADLREVRRPTREDVVSDVVFANGALRFLTDWRLRGGANARLAEREGVTRDSVESTAVTAFAGVDYVTGLGNSIGIEARQTRGDAPVTRALDPTGSLRSRYREQEIAGVLIYNLGSQLTVAGRLGATARDYEELPIPDFDGTTGRARIDWRPAVKLSFVFEVARELRPLLDVDATHVLVNSLTFGPSWAPTLKLVFNARFIQERREYNSTATLGLPVVDDTLRVISLGAGWEPRRHYTLGFGTEWGERTSNTLGRDYDYIAAMANFRYDW